MGAIRADRFCDGTLQAFFEDGFIVKWLKILKNIDDEQNIDCMMEIYFEIGGFGGYDTYHLFFDGEGESHLVRTLAFEGSVLKYFSKDETSRLLNQFMYIRADNWNGEYSDPYICDETQWELAIKYKNQRGTVWQGSNAYPNNWNDLLNLFDIDNHEIE